MKMAIIGAILLLLILAGLYAITESGNEPSSPDSPVPVTPATPGTPVGNKNFNF